MELATLPIEISCEIFSYLPLVDVYRMMVGTAALCALFYRRVERESIPLELWLEMLHSPFTIRATTPSIERFHHLLLVSSQHQLEEYLHTLHSPRVDALLSNVIYHQHEPSKIMVEVDELVIDSTYFSQGYHGNPMRILEEIALTFGLSSSIYREWRERVFTQRSVFVNRNAISDYLLDVNKPPSVLYQRIVENILRESPHHLSEFVSNTRFATQLRLHTPIPEELIMRVDIGDDYSVTLLTDILTNDDSSKVHLWLSLTRDLEVSSLALLAMAVDRCCIQVIACVVGEYLGDLGVISRLSPATQRSFHQILSSNPILAEYLTQRC